jgi:hypothetical protein
VDELLTADIRRVTARMADQTTTETAVRTASSTADLYDGPVAIPYK